MKYYVSDTLDNISNVIRKKGFNCLKLTCMCAWLYLCKTHVFHFSGA